MTDADVLVRKDGEVLRVTINRPRKHNALSRPLLGRLRQVFEGQASDNRLKVAILTGAGGKYFAAGGDLRDLAAVRTLAETRDMAENAKAALNAIRRFPVPVLAALNGDAMGGGAELAVACDFRVAAAGARIGFVQGRLNIATAWGGGVDLMCLLGPSRALGLLCRGDMLAPAAALSLGLIDGMVTADEDLDAAIDRFIDPLRRQAPQVLRAFKSLARKAREGAGQRQLQDLETLNFAAVWRHPDHWAVADKFLAKSDRRE